MASKDSLIDIMKDYSDLKHLEGLVLQFRQILKELETEAYSYVPELLDTYDKHFNIISHRYGVITKKDLDGE